jgi:hypothetical protein
MLEKKPVKSEDLVVKWTEFVAEFGQLPELESHARQLSFLQLVSLDILLPFSSALIVVLLLLYKLVRMLAKKCFASSKLKDE